VPTISARVSWLIWARLGFSLFTQKRRAAEEPGRVFVQGDSVRCSLSQSTSKVKLTVVAATRKEATIEAPWKRRKGALQKRLPVAIVIVLIIVEPMQVMHVNISALPEPGRFETSIATQAKDCYISRAARGLLPPAPINNPSRASAGETLFGMECATCHGRDGHQPTPIGNAMYPRVLDLSSPEVQEMSDRNIFWVVKNGIRLSGMPGFAKIESDEQIWELAYR